MPLPKSAPRKMLHLRDIFLRGYEREDGLVDVEAHLTDTKTYTSYSQDGSALPSGQPVHDMWLRLTIARDMTIIDCVAAMDSTPHHVCPSAAPNYAALVGLNVGKGFLKAAAERIGGAKGCTHLREILQQVATTAFQTMISVNGHDLKSVKPKDNASLDAWLNSCYAFDEKGPLVASLRGRIGTTDKEERS